MTCLGHDIAIWDLDLRPLGEALLKALRSVFPKFPSGILVIVGTGSPDPTNFHKAWASGEEAGSKLTKGLSPSSEYAGYVTSSDFEFLEDELISLEDFKQCYEDYYGVEALDLDLDYEFIEGPSLGILKEVKGQPDLHIRSPPG